MCIRDRYIIVCPTYAWRIPRVVEQFIRTNHFVSGTKIYFIMTCGGDIGNAAKYINRLCNEKNMILMGIGEIVMQMCIRDRYLIRTYPLQNICVINLNLLMITLQLFYLDSLFCHKWILIEE